MGIKYKPGKLNPVFTDPNAQQLGNPSYNPFAAQNAGAPGGIGTQQAQNDITKWGVDLAQRVKMGDPAAIMEVQELVRAEKKTVGDDRRNLARKISNTYLDTKYLTPYDDSSVLGDLAPGLAIMGGIAGLGLLAPAMAGGGAAAGASGFGTAGMAGATGAGGLAAAGGAGLGAAGAGAAGSAGGGGGGLGALGAGAAGSAGGAGGAASGAGGLLSAAGGAGGVLGGIKQNLPLILGGLGAVQSASQYGQANNLRQQAIDMAKQDYAGRAPLRDAFTAGALKALPQRPDLSGMLRTTNPYQNPVPR